MSENALATILATGRRVETHRGFSRIEIDAAAWQAIAAQLGNGRATLSALWGDTGAVHMAVQDESMANLAVVSLACPEDRFPSVGQFHPPAIRLERTIRDLFGLIPENAPDTRAWLDYGRWDVCHPLGKSPGPASASPYEFLAAEGESIHQIAVGPVHAGIIEPGHFRFNVNGEAVVRLEARLGYTHKGVEGLMRGSDIGRGAKLAGRASGDSTVAHAIAFARAVEAALQVKVPARAHWLRALMAELERLANHIGDIGAICNDASFSLIQAHCAILRERVLRAADMCFGHRLMRDCVEPGGVANDISAEGVAQLRALLAELRHRFPNLVRIYDNTASLQDRTVGTGILRAALAAQFGAGGFIGRASGRNFDARRNFPYPPYDALRFDVPIRQDGDVNARVWVRIQEVEQSMSLLEQILSGVPSGPLHTEFSAGGGEGVSVVEGFRGDVLISVRLNDDGSIARCHMRDPSWFQWPLLEAAIEGNIVADFPLCNKSFNCSYSGHDL
ncbi:MAG TPA: nickel-dependent hydrogenase large subunit [Micropepsaceae bacterium]|nr:nickel-dependent hydrogenase large subunit [Micropepsaceae bacterium]